MLTGSSQSKGWTLPFLALQLAKTRPHRFVTFSMKRPSDLLKECLSQVAAFHEENGEPLAVPEGTGEEVRRVLSWP